jgi:hypothetical protein
MGCGINDIPTPESTDLSGTGLLQAGWMNVSLAFFLLLSSVQPNPPLHSVKVATPNHAAVALEAATCCCAACVRRAAKCDMRWSCLEPDFRVRDNVNDQYKLADAYVRMRVTREIEIE